MGQVIQGSYEFKVGSLSQKITTPPSLMLIGIVPVKSNVWITLWLGIFQVKSPSCQI